MLDRDGGTEVMPVHPAKIQFSQGLEKLACVRLSDDGMIRWFTTCCKSAVANSMPIYRWPFVGFHSTLIIGGPAERERLSGPVSAHVNSGRRREDVWSIILFLRFLAVGLARGLHQPNPFPTVPPLVQSDEEYDRLIEKVRAARKA
jgi:hypothetical protein